MSYSQDTCIVAGDSTLTHYTDLIPDETLTSPGGYLPPDTIPLDINNDGIFDFKVEVWNITTSHSSFGHARITSYGNNEILVNTINQSMADTLSNTDTVCTAGVWKHLGLFFDYLGTFDSTTSYYNFYWTNIGDRNVGLKLINPIDTAFGWVKISINGTSANVRSFGCGTITPFVPPTSPGITPATSGVVIFPNPTYDFVNIYLPNNSIYEIKLFNDLGETIYQNIGNQKIIDLTPFSVGVYVLKIITNDKTITEKIIKSKMQN